MVMEMKVAKIRKKEVKQVESTVENYSFKSIVKILLSIAIIYIVFYFITIMLVDNNSNNDNVNNSEVSIDSTKITLGQILNRNESDYYVIATKNSLYNSAYIETNYSKIYNKYIDSYLQKENSIPFYFVDLDSALNKGYLSDKTNITNKIEKLKLSDEILFKISNGKIEKYYEGKEKIIEKLSKI